MRAKPRREISVQITDNPLKKEESTTSYHDDQRVGSEENHGAQEHWTYAKGRIIPLDHTMTNKGLQTRRLDGATGYDTAYKKYHHHQIIS